MPITRFSANYPCGVALLAAMIARDVNEVDRQIADLRHQINEQQAIIRGFEQQGDTGEALQAGVVLRVLEDNLSLLLERRKAILNRARRPRAKSKPEHAVDSRRRSRGT
jgi:hypothetical protein